MAIIKKLKKCASSGFDGVSSNLLLQISDYILKSITHLANLSFKKSIFLLVYKKSLVIPLYKTEETRDTLNYRPISLISSINKIIEKLANIQLQRFIINNNGISDKQFGLKEHICSQSAISYLANLV